MHLNRFTIIFVSYLKAIQIQSQGFNVFIIIDCQLSASGRYVSPYVARDSWPLTNQRPVLWLLTNQRRVTADQGRAGQDWFPPRPWSPTGHWCEPEKVVTTVWVWRSENTSVISDPWSELSVHCRQPGTYLKILWTLLYNFFVVMRWTILHYFFYNLVVLET